MKVTALFKNGGDYFPPEGNRVCNAAAVNAAALLCEESFRIFRGFIPRKMLFASRARRDPSSRDSFVMAKPSQTKLFRASSFQ
jgi:hypothetical protein